MKEKKHSTILGAISVIAGLLIFVVAGINNNLSAISNRTLILTIALVIIGILLVLDPGLEFDEDPEIKCDE